MPASDSYGEAFGRRVNARASGFVTRSLPRAQLAVTELCYEDPRFIFSTPPVEEDAFVVGVHLKLFERYEYWENGKATAPSTLPPGQAIIYDLKRKPIFRLNGAFHSVHFYLPTSALRSIAEDAQARPVDELRYRPAVPHADPFLRANAEALLPLFVTPQRANRVLRRLHNACRWPPYRGQLRGNAAPDDAIRGGAFTLAGAVGESDPPGRPVRGRSPEHSRDGMRTFRVAVRPRLPPQPRRASASLAPAATHRARQGTSSGGSRLAGGNRRCDGIFQPKPLHAQLQRPHGTDARALAPVGARIGCGPKCQVYDRAT